LPKSVKNQQADQDQEATETTGIVCVARQQGRTAAGCGNAEYGPGDGSMSGVKFFSYRIKVFVARAGDVGIEFGRNRAATKAALN
jgi:hypothetical protein